MLSTVQQNYKYKDREWYKKLRLELDEEVGEKFIIDTLNLYEARRNDNLDKFPEGFWSYKHRDLRYKIILSYLFFEVNNYTLEDVYSKVDRMWFYNNLIGHSMFSHATSINKRCELVFSELLPWCFKHFSIHFYSDINNFYGFIRYAVLKYKLDSYDFYKLTKGEFPISECLKMKNFERFRHLSFIADDFNLEFNFKLTDIYNICGLPGYLYVEKLLRSFIYENSYEYTVTNNFYNFRNYLGVYFATIADLFLLCLEYDALDYKDLKYVTQDFIDSKSKYYGCKGWTIDKDILNFPRTKEWVKRIPKYIKQPNLELFIMHVDNNSDLPINYWERNGKAPLKEILTYLIEEKYKLTEEQIYDLDDNFFIENRLGRFVLPELGDTVSELFKLYNPSLLGFKFKYKKSLIVSDLIDKIKYDAIVNNWYIYDIFSLNNDYLKNLDTNIIDIESLKYAINIGYDYYMNLGDVSSYNYDCLFMCICYRWFVSFGNISMSFLTVQLLDDIDMMRYFKDVPDFTIDKLIAMCNEYNSKFNFSKTKVIGIDKFKEINRRSYGLI